jgi:hypothetical protein
MARGTDAEQVYGKQPKLARGSRPEIDVKATVAGWAPGPQPVVDDDQPTRGRYTFRRPPTSPGDRV